MTTHEFRKAVRSLGLVAQKQKGLEVFDIFNASRKLCHLTYADVFNLDSLEDVAVAIVQRDKSYYPQMEVK